MQLSTEAKTKLIAFLRNEIRLDDLNHWAITERQGYDALSIDDRAFLDSFEARFFELSQRHITEQDLRQFFFDSMKITPTATPQVLETITAFGNWGTAEVGGPPAPSRSSSSTLPGTTAGANAQLAELTT